MQLPQTLNQSDNGPSLALLECYYGRGAHAHHHPDSTQADPRAGRTQ